MPVLVETYNIISNTGTRFEIVRIHWQLVPSGWSCDLLHGLRLGGGKGQ